MRMWKRAARAVLVCGVAAGTVFTGAAWAVGGGPSEIPQVSRAELSIDGHPLAIFSRCMIASAAEAPGAEPTTTEIRCERALTRNIELAAWHELVLLGDAAAAEKDFSLTMYDTAGEPVAAWQMNDGYPAEHTTYFDEAGFGREIVTFSGAFMQRVPV